MSDPRRRIPAINTLIDEARAAGIDAPHGVLLRAARTVVASVRASGTAADTDWPQAIGAEVARLTASSLRRVINATGVVLHTNLGRAPLADRARAATDAALGYSTLELDVDDGGRGSRQDHVRSLLTELTGAEDAVVVNNAASALILALNALASGGETVVSRGELVEIGGSFRIPDILQRSGSVLVEVGTTNRTRRRDYELALSPRTQLLMKVHRSNFHLEGFVEETGIADLVQLGSTRRIPALHDVGSGLLLSLEEFGLTGEPLVTDSVATGAVVVFSGDKLLGGPQAGIIVGPARHIRTLAGNPLARAFRPDKATFAALESTLHLYRDRDEALASIPVLRMLSTPADTLRRRARRLARRLVGSTVAAGSSAVGGGAFPHCALPTFLVTLPVPSCDAFLARLREQPVPVIARTADDRVVLDVRTVADDELPTLADAVHAAGWSAPEPS